jgi:tRNA-binding protein
MEEANNRHLTWDDFMKVEMRVGTILSAEIFQGARNPAYILQIDFGETGIKKTSAQITRLYQPDEIMARVRASGFRIEEMFI